MSPTPSLSCIGTIAESLPCPTSFDVTHTLPWAQALAPGHAATLSRSHSQGGGSTRRARIRGLPRLSRGGSSPSLPIAGDAGPTAAERRAGDLQVRLGSMSGLVVRSDWTSYACRRRVTYPGWAPCCGKSGTSDVFRLCWRILHYYNRCRLGDAA